MTFFLVIAAMDLKHTNLHLLTPMCNLPQSLRLDWRTCSKPTQTQKKHVMLTKTQPKVKSEPGTPEL